MPPAFVSADPIYPDPWPIVDDGATAPHASPNNGIGNNDEKKFVFNGYHWLIIVGAFIVGFVLGMFL